MANVQAVNLGAEIKAAQALKPGSQTQAGTKGCMKNDTHWTLKFDKSHDWDGSNCFDMPYPRVIQPHQPGVFIHRAHSANGCKEAFIYEATSGDAVYLVAYHAPYYCNENRVYVECGNRDKFFNINWVELENKLDSSTNVASSTDPSTGISINAEIDGGSAIASLAVRYGEMPLPPVY